MEVPFHDFNVGIHWINVCCQVGTPAAVPAGIKFIVLLWKEAEFTPNPKGKKIYHCLEPNSFIQPVAVKCRITFCSCHYMCVADEL